MSKATKKSTTKKTVRHTRHKHIKTPIVVGIFGGWILLAIVTGAILFRVINANKPIAINHNGVKLTVKSVSYDTKGKQPFVAPAGWKFAIVDVSVQNNRLQSFWFAPVLQTYITDKAGNKFTMSPLDMQHPVTAGPLSPGSSTTGSISYLVPVDATNTSFQFDPLQ